MSTTTTFSLFLILNVLLIITTVGGDQPKAEDLLGQLKDFRVDLIAGLLKNPAMLSSLASTFLPKSVHQASLEDETCSKDDKLCTKSPTAAPPVTSGLQADFFALLSEDITKLTVGDLLHKLGDLVQRHPEELGRAVDSVLQLGKMFN